MRNYFLIICMFLFLCAAVMIGKSEMNFSSAHTNTVNIVALGDSITFGTGDPLKKGYVGRVKERLEQYKGNPVRISNYGIPKYRTEDVLKQLKVHKIQKAIQQANYIIINIGTNDFRKSADYQFVPINQWKMLSGKQVFSDNLSQILSQIRKKNERAPIFVLGLYHPYMEYDNRRQLLDLIAGFNSEMADIAGQFNHTFYVPMLDLFINSPKNSCFSDSLHLNGAGYEKMAKRLADRIMLIESNEIS